MGDAAAPSALHRRASSIGCVCDGRWVKGFLVEAEAVNGVRYFGVWGWREFVAKGAAASVEEQIEFAKPVMGLSSAT